MAIHNISNNVNFSKVQFKSNINNINEYEDFSKLSGLEKFNAICNGEVDSITFKNHFSEYTVKFDGVSSYYYYGQKVVYLNMKSLFIEVYNDNWYDLSNFDIEVVIQNGKLNLYWCEEDEDHLRHIYEVDFISMS